MTIHTEVLTLLFGHFCGIRDADCVMALFTFFCLWCICEGYAFIYVCNKYQETDITILGSSFKFSFLLDSNSSNRWATEIQRGAWEQLRGTCSPYRGCPFSYRPSQAYAVSRAGSSLCSSLTCFLERTEVEHLIVHCQHLWNFLFFWGCQVCQSGFCLLQVGGWQQKMRINCFDWFCALFWYL